MTPLVRARGLGVSFARRGLLPWRADPAPVQALDAIDLDVKTGETLAVVGESGSGKSTLARAMLRTLEPTRGRVYFRDIELTALPPDRLREARRHMQMVFQSAIGAFNPRLRIGAAIAEPLVVHALARGDELRERVREALELVGLDPADAARYPHEFSGGQLQRIGIARAVISRPDFIVADEALSALDPSLQAQILALFSDLKQRFALTYLFISHDLAVVRRTCDRVAVMYLGRIVELGTTSALFAEPKHPYTRALIDAIPVPNVAAERARPYRPLAGEPPSPSNPPPGCPFHPRCPQARDRCRIERPALESAGPGRQVACHYPLSDARSTE